MLLRRRALYTKPAEEAYILTSDNNTNNNDNNPQQTTTYEIVDLISTLISVAQTLQPIPHTRTLDTMADQGPEMEREDSISSQDPHKVKEKKAKNRKPASAYTSF